jgi:hypothetical protein
VIAAVLGSCSSAPCHDTPAPIDWLGPVVKAIGVAVPIALTLAAMTALVILAVGTDLRERRVRKARAPR